MNVRVEINGKEHQLTLTPTRPMGQIDPDPDSWEVASLSGRRIGRVFKSSYTYSPPTHRGSRIVRYHHQVSCWQAECGPQDDRRRGLHRKTRKESLIEIVREYTRRCQVQDQLHQFALAHPEATFRLHRGERAAGHGYRGKVILLHAGNAIYVRDKAKGDVKVKLRELEQDQGPRLEVRLGKGRYEAVAEVLYREFGSSY